MMKLSDLRTSEEVLAGALRDPAFRAEWSELPSRAPLLRRWLRIESSMVCHSERWQTSFICRSPRWLGVNAGAALWLFVIRRSVVSCLLIAGAIGVAVALFGVPV
jgi:hypothetical protein